jgi:hypothetical protein
MRADREAVHGTEPRSNRPVASAKWKYAKHARQNEN